MLRRKRWLFALMAILPTLAIFAWVRIYPIWETLRLSVHKWDILSKNKPFIGMANFAELFRDRLFLEALTNTAIIAFGVLLITIPLSLVLAALIHEVPDSGRRHHATSTKTRFPSTFTGKVRRFTQTGVRFASPVR